MSLDDWTTRERPGREPLSGVRIILEPLDWAVHLEGLFGAVAGPQNADIWTYMPIGPFERPEAFQKIFSLVQAKAGWEPLVIRNKDSGKILGMAGYMRICRIIICVRSGCRTGRTWCCFAILRIIPVTRSATG